MSKKLKIIAIDPGNEKSGFVVSTDKYSLSDFGKVDNDDIFCKIKGCNPDVVVIEMIKSMGMRVGQTVFETCVFIGRIVEYAILHGIKYSFVYRHEEKTTICGDPTANDASIRRVLIDEFASHDKERGKGTKNNPDFFYGFNADVWQAFAVLVTYLNRDDDNNGKRFNVKR